LQFPGLPGFPASFLLLPRSVEAFVISFLFVLLIVLVIGALPAWPYSRTWGFYPSGVIGLVLIALIVMALSGRL
jgi:Protein of unknown function (DUF3309)